MENLELEELEQMEDVSLKPQLTRVSYLHRKLGKEMSSLELELAVKLRAKTNNVELEDLEAAVSSLQQRSADSFCALALLIPDHVSVPRFAVEQGYLQDDAVLLGFGCFGVTGIVHDLSFDYEAIDQLSSKTDRKTDRILLGVLLEGHETHMVAAMADASDSRRRQLLAAENFKVQRVIDSGVLYSRRAKSQ